jgi:tRNA dimethylallyltransferase
VAQRLGAEIISLDSMAIYRGMDIGTAKPSAAEQGGVPHHLIDIIEPHQEFSVAQYVSAAEQAVREIVARGRRPLFVGGTPLYLKALLRGIFEGPPADWELRRELENFAELEGNEALHRRLASVDPVSSRRLHLEDRRRVIRALEVFEKTGQRISELQQQFERAKPAEERRVFTITWPREKLVERIDRRVDAMFAAGLADEVRDLLKVSGTIGRSAGQALGYREVLEHLRGERGIAETIELVKQRTRQFAKRQMTWFRSLSECRIVPAEPGTEEVVASIASQLQS